MSNKSEEDAVKELADLAAMPAEEADRASREMRVLEDVRKRLPLLVEPGSLIVIEAIPLDHPEAPWGSLFSIASWPPKYSFPWERENRE